MGFSCSRQQNPSGLDLLAGELDPTMKAIAALNPLAQQLRMSGDLLVEILPKGLTVFY